MPAKGTTKVSETQKQAIVALRMQGVSNCKIAAKLGVHPITVSKVYGEFRREVAPLIDDLGDWRRDLKILAVRAVRRGLIDESDNFKSGNLGVQALKGLGDFEHDGGTVNIQALINSIPEGQRDRYITLETATEETNAIETKTTEDTAGE